MNHSFDVQIAKEYGVNEAIFIENMRFWLAKNKANGRHFYDGRTWTYNSMKAFAELFPYWSINQVRRIIENLEKLGVLLTGNYNASAYDRTNWYSLNLQLHLANLPNGNGENAKSLIDTDINQITAPLRSALFDKFWHHYPKKVAKDAAEKAFNKRKPDEKLALEMIQAVEQQAASEAWTKEGGKYIPNPATWLNQGRWKDSEQSSTAVNMFAGAI